MTRNKCVRFRRDMEKQVLSIATRSTWWRKFMKKVTQTMRLTGLGDPEDWHVRVYPTLRLQHWSSVDVLCNERASQGLRRAAFRLLRAWDVRMRETGGRLWQYKETWKIVSHYDLRLMREGAERRRRASPQGKEEA
jgi:ribosomal protein L16/L10AE